MKKLLILIFLMGSAFAKAQTYSSQIIPNNSMMLDGYVGEHPISMYIELTGYCEYEKEYSGWYKYGSSNESIPIMFYHSSYPEDQGFKIFAKYDGDFEMEIDEDYACQVITYDEVFDTTAINGIFSGLQWSKKDSKTGLTVRFDSDAHDKFWELGEQDVYLTKDEVIILDLGTLGFSWAYEVDIIGQKLVGEVNHLLIGISEPSKPGGNGRGMCGGGEENYILYLRLDDKDKLLFKDSAHVYSCFQEIDESTFTYDAAFPEDGIIRQ